MMIKSTCNHFHKMLLLIEIKQHSRRSDNEEACYFIVGRKVIIAGNLRIICFLFSA